MGPNLTRLFDHAKDGNPAAQSILRDIFIDHDKALVEALEKLIELDDYPYKAVVQAKALLEVLEQEAGQ